METKLFFSTEICKLFLVGLVSDCFGYVFSMSIFNKGGNRKRERRYKIVRNRVFDWRLSPDCKLFLVALVSDCFGYVFSRPILNKHFSRRQSKTLKYYRRRSLET